MNNNLFGNFNPFFTQIFTPPLDGHLIDARISLENQKVELIYKLRFKGPVPAVYPPPDISQFPDRIEVHMFSVKDGKLIYDGMRLGKHVPYQKERYEY